MHPVVNKWLDLIDRVGGTFLQVLGGVLIDFVLSDGNITWKAILYTVLLALGKVLVGQRIGTDETGAVIPNVIEPPPTENK